MAEIAKPFGRLAVGQKIIDNQNPRPRGQVFLRHADMVLHAVGEAENRGFIHVPGHIAGAALLGENHGNIPAGHGRGQRHGDAAGLNGQNKVRLLGSKDAGESLTHFYK